MSATILKAELLLGTRKALVSCPRGTAGRIYALRLSRRFHCPHKLWSTALPVSSINESVPSSPEQTHSNISHRWPVEDAVKKHAGQPSSIDASNGTITGPSVVSSYRPFRRALIRNGRMHKSRIAKAFDTIEDRTLPRAKSVLSNSLHNPRIGSSDEDIRSFHEILKAGDAHKILRKLLVLTPKGRRWEELAAEPLIRSLSPAAFSEVLRSLDPDILLGDLLRSRQDFSPNHPVYAELKLQNSKTGQYRLAQTFMRRISIIIEARRAAGFDLQLSDYKALLRCARTAGNQEMAQNLWKNMREDGITPDTECYNCYMAIKTLSDAVHPLQRWKLRNTPFNEELRRNLLDREHSQKPLAYQGYSVGSGGIKFQMTRLFNQMVQSGSLGDEETFCLMMMAFGREGDVESLKSILSRVWGLDVAALLKLDEHDVPPMRQYPPGSSMRPSSSLLFTIAHVFGINNQVEPALRLIDYISRQYSLQIPTEVWEELLERTFILSRWRAAEDRGIGDDLGKLHPGSVEDLWYALIAEPYKMKPTMRMYDRVITTLIRMDRFDSAHLKIQAGRLEHISLVKQYGRTRLLLQRQRAARCQPKFVETPDSLQRLTELKRQEAIEYTIVHRSRQYIRKWCRSFIRRGSQKHRLDLFHYSGLQTFLKQFDLFVPNVIEYHTATGHVRFYSGSLQKSRAKARELAQPLKTSMPRQKSLREHVRRDWIKGKEVLSERRSKVSSRSR